MADPEPPAPEDEPPKDVSARPDEPKGAAGWIAPFFQDSTLWPVLLVAVIIFVTLLAAGLLLAVVERNPFAVGAMLLALWISVDIALRERRRGDSSLASWSLAGLWALSVATAFAVHRAGYF